MIADNRDHQGPIFITETVVAIHRKAQIPRRHHTFAVQTEPRENNNNNNNNNNNKHNNIKTASQSQGV